MSSFRLSLQRWKGRHDIEASNNPGALAIEPHISAPHMVHCLKASDHKVFQKPSFFPSRWPSIDRSRQTVPHIKSGAPNSPK